MGDGPINRSVGIEKQRLNPVFSSTCRPGGLLKKCFFTVATAWVFLNTSTSRAQIEGHQIETSANHAVAAIQDTETTAQRDSRMSWWRAARFGMFIHWGL